MKIFTEPCVCDVCGGPGLARPDHAISWFGGLRHTNPDVCAGYLREQREKLEEREKAVREAEERLAPAGAAEPSSGAPRPRPGA